MTPDQILDRPAKILSQKQREDYFAKGYVMAASIIPTATVERLLDVTASFVEKSKSVTKSDTVFDVDNGHTAENPKLRRLSSPVDQDPTYWDFAASQLMADIAEDLVGPNVKFHHSKLNFKWAAAGQEVKWHQDIQAWPHTDYSPLTMGIYLQDTTKEMGPLLCVPGSHEGELFDHFDELGTMDRSYPRYGYQPRGRQDRRDAVRAGRKHHHSQLPHRPCVRTESIASRPATVASHVLFRRIFPLYAEPNPEPAFRRDHSRTAPEMGQS